MHDNRIPPNKELVGQVRTGRSRGEGLGPAAGGRVVAAIAVVLDHTTTAAPYDPKEAFDTDAAVTATERFGHSLAAVHARPIAASAPAG
ncbi:hypothetical protein [Streptomyces sp. NPDC088760]|uniref:hypothetical protein n=1 Tax=Streptomyces sp. NPDC088760 TaxID=3365890 RepID=UPI00382BD530